MFQTPEAQLNKVEIGNLPEKGSRVMIDLGKRMEAQTEKIQDMFNKELDLKNKQTDINNTITEMKKYTRRN